MKNVVDRTSLVLAATCLLCGVAAGADTVVLKNARHKGKVSRDDARGVALTLAGGGGTLQFKRDDVEEVIYDDGRPVEYKIGIESYRMGRYEAALESLEAAMEVDHHPLLEQYILYHMGLCGQRLGRLDKAVEALEKLKGQGTKTRFLIDAVSRLVELELARNNAADARKHLNDLKGAGEIDRAQFALLSAQIAEKLGNHAAAADLYRKAGEQGDARASEEAQLGSARCSLAGKRYDEAVRQLNDLVRRERSDATLAQAYVLLGDALREQAKTPDDYEKAMLAYMHVPCLYKGDEATEAKALYHASKCFLAMKAENSADRSAKLVGKLRRSYPNSEWAKMTR